MLILNFGHPLTPAQLEQISALLTGHNPDRVLDIRLQLEQTTSLLPQIVTATDTAGLTSVEWQTLPILINLPGYAPAAAAIVAEIEGRSGHLPAIIKTRPVPNALMTEYEVMEIVNLQEARAQARARR